MDLVASWVGELWSRPRFAIPLLLGIGAGAALFHLTGQEPSSAAMAAGCILLGLLIGFALEYLREPHEPSA